MSDEVHELEITDVGYGGDGVGHLEEGIAVFVPFTAVGDRVRVRLTERRKRFARGEVLKILSPGSDRTEPECKYFGRCGGCAYQHLTVEAELQLKLKQLRDLLTRIGGFQDLPEISPVVQSPQHLGYRNRLTLHPIRIESEKVHYGYVGVDGKSRVDIRECPLAMPAVSKYIMSIGRHKWARKNASRDRPKPASIRVDSRGDRQLWFGRPPANIPWPHEELDDGSVIRVPLGSFTQVNPEVGKALLAWLRKHTLDNPTDAFVDAYCGAGAFALAAAPQTKLVYGLELDQTAMQAARVNAESLELDNCVWIDGDVAAMLGGVLDGTGASGSVRLLLDPPRGGCDQAVIDLILATPPDEIVAVSCNASTLARDLAKLKDAYDLVDLALFDMFPRTAHFEAVAVLKRRQA